MSITDVNDVSPRFSQLTYSTRLPEVCYISDIATKEFIINCKIIVLISLLFLEHKSYK